MSNSGNVSLNVQVVGQDEVSAMLAQIAKQAKKTEEQLKGVGNADITPETSGISKATAAFGNTVEAVDKAEEKFNKLVGAIGFVGAAFAIVPTVFAFAKELLNAESASERASQSVGKLSDMLIKAKNDFIEFDKARAATESARIALEIEEKIVKASDAGAEVARERIELESQLMQIMEKQKENDYGARLASLQAFVKENEKDLGYARDIMNARVRINQLTVYAGQEQKEINFLQGELNKAKSAEQRYAEEILKLEQDKGEAIRGNLKELKETLSQSRILYQLSGGLFGAKPEEEKPKLPTGGPRAKTKSEIGEERTRQRIEDDAALEKAMEALDKRLEAEERTRLALQNQLAISEDVMEFEAAIIAEVEAFADLADTVDTATSSFDDFAQAVLGAADAFPELSDAMEGINASMQKHAQQVAKDKDLIAKGELTAAEATVNAEQSRTQAIIEGSTAGVGAIAKLIGGKKAEYAIRAAGEVAMGFATLANPVESAGHFVAAGLFAAAAGTSAPTGGGAGGGAGAAQETPSSSSMGYDQGGTGQRTVVYNFSTLIADRQQVGRAIRDSELVGQRNGYGRRRGV